MASTEDGDTVIIDSNEISKASEALNPNGVHSTGQAQPSTPVFGKLSAREMSGGRDAYQRVRIPAHRYTPLKSNWENIMRPLVEHMKIQVRFNPKTRMVEMKTSEYTQDPGALQKSADFVHAFALGFEVQDAIALLRLDDLFIDTFEIKDVKMLHGDHLSRAIGRIAGQVSCQHIILGSSISREAKLSMQSKMQRAQE